MIDSGDYFVHASCSVDEEVAIGVGTKVWHFTHIQRGAVIGKQCVLGQNVNIGPDVQIGDRVHIQNNVSVYQGVTLEDCVFCGPSSVFTNVLTPRVEYPVVGRFAPTLVKYGASLGANCTVVCGHVIGRYALIGAGAVVTEDVPDFALMVGNPARQKGWVCACGKTLDPDTLTCSCGMCYERTEEGLLRPL